jgi:hypothetical protein
LLDITIRDLQRAAADPDVTINMDTWLRREGGTCEACAAGAVMLYGMEDVPRFESVVPDYFGGHNSCALRAIECFREGRVYAGCKYLGVKNSKVQSREMTYYVRREVMSLKALLWDLRCLADEFRAEVN